MQEIAMSKTKAAATPVAPVRNPEVGALIIKSGEAAASMLALAREAAQKAAPQLNPKKPIRARLDEVVSLYTADFTAAGHNVRALFVDALVLLSADKTPVTVTVGKEQKQVTAGEAVTMPKHALKAAAKQVRETLEIGRKEGGGRKPKSAAEKIEAAEKSVGTAPDIKAQTDKFSEWLDMLPEYLTDAVFNARVVAAMVALGYTVNKAAKGRVVQGTAGA